MTCLGKQKGNTIDYLSEDSLFSFKVGEKKTLKEIIKEEQADVEKNRWLLRCMIGICIGIFVYSTLANEMINFFISIPLIGFKMNSG